MYLLFFFIDRTDFLLNIIFDKQNDAEIAKLFQDSATQAFFNSKMVWHRATTSSTTECLTCQAHHLPVIGTGSQFTPWMYWYAKWTGPVI